MFNVCYKHVLQFSTDTEFSDKCVLNTAARVVTGTRKFDRGLGPLHDELHWLDVPVFFKFKLAVIVHRCHS